MKKRFSFFLMLASLFTISTLLPQLLSAQPGDFSRVKVHASPSQFFQIGLNGVPVDHIHRIDKSRFIGEFSAEEITRIETAGGSIEYLIEDLRDYYHHQNDNWSPNKTGGIQSTPVNFNYGSMGGYLTFQEMVDELDSMALLYPNLITVKTNLGNSLEGRPIWMVKISDNPGTDESEPEAFYNSIHHAREPNALMQLIYYMWYLLENYGSDPMVTHLVNNREMYFVPMINPDGYVYNQTTDPMGGGMWRKNRRNNGAGSFGVDLNRNYGFSWGHDNFGSSPDPTSATYRGTAAFSEPETQVIKTFCENRDFKIAFNYHSYGDWVIYPWGYIPNRTPDSLRFIQFGEVLTRENNYIYGTGTETVGYTVNGDSDDWMYGEQTTKGKIMSMTPEVGEQFFGFWPPQSEIIRLADENLAANLHLACLAGECINCLPHPTPPITGTTYQLPADFHNLGLTDAQPVSASFLTSDPNILSVNNNPRNLGSITSNQIVTDSFDLTLAAGIAEGTLLTGVIETQYSGGYVQTDSVSFRYGTPVVLFSSDGETITRDDWDGTWARTTERAHSGVYSITDSPNFSYTPYDYNFFVTDNPIDLSGIVAPWIEFYATWQMEKNWDYVQFQVSPDGANFNGLAGQFSRPGTGLSVQPANEPIYDGLRIDWVHENISLIPFAGMPQLWLRFLLESDGYVEYDGYYFDDLLVQGYSPLTGLEDQLDNQSELFLYPNPASSTLRIGARSANTPSATLEVYSLLGTQLLSTIVNPGVEIDLPEWESGVYLYRFVDGDKSSPMKKLMVR